MQCPVCKTKSCSPIYLEEKLKAASCKGCGGHWISHRNYTTWLRQQSDSQQEGPEGPFSEFEFSVNDVQDAKLCPDCAKILLKYKVGNGLDFFVDHCPGCGGIWLDTNEWKALKRRNLHDDIQKIFSTSWQSKVRGDKMARMLEQVYTNRFGDESYERAKAIRQWLETHPQKKAIIAFLLDEDPYTIGSWTEK